MALPRVGRREVLHRPVHTRTDLARSGEARFAETRANRQPALAVYTRDQASGPWRGSGLLVITVQGDQIAGLTRFESHILRPFGLPRILLDDPPKSPGPS
jgi:hypothetical protein